MKKLWCTLLLLLVFPHPAFAQAGIEIVEQNANYIFNDSIDFHAQFESSKKIIDGYVLFELEGQDRTWVYEGDIQDKYLDVHIAISPDNLPKAYSPVTYWYRLASDHGEFFESPRYTFFYADNRFDWKEVEAAPFTLRWHNGDAAFAANVLAAANQGILRTQAMLPLPSLAPVTLQVYDNPADVQLVAQLAGYQWAAGHTDPTAALILFALPPGAQQSLEIERQVPHEVAHLMLYQGLGAQGYANLPAWLNEGIASNVEVYSDPLRSQWLRLGNESEALFPFYSLCLSFPQDEASARLAYAQSASFVRYLLDQFNPAGFATLVSDYAENGDCLNAPSQTFGKDLNQLEADWRLATFDQANPLLQNIASLPWATILAAAGLAGALWGIPRLLARRK